MDLFHLVQQHLISSKGADLVRSLRDLVLQSSIDDPKSIRIVRFAIHMILFMRETDLFGAKQETLTQEAESALVRYMHHLIRSK